MLTTTTIIIIVWNLDTRTLTHTFDLCRGPITCLQVDERSIIAACRADGFQNTITIIDFNNESMNMLQGKNMEFNYENNEAKTPPSPLKARISRQGTSNYLDADSEYVQAGSEELLSDSNLNYEGSDSDEGFDVWEDAGAIEI